MTPSESRQNLLLAAPILVLGIIFGYGDITMETTSVQKIPKAKI